LSAFGSFADKEVANKRVNQTARSVAALTRQAWVAPLVTLVMRFKDFKWTINQLG
jgi:hypothetical protein